MAVVMILAGVGLIAIPDFAKKKEMKAEQLLLEIMSTDRLISTDDLAEMIIGKNPLLQLIDVRTPEEFAEYSLPNAVNIPLADLLTKDKDGDYVWEDYLNQDTKINVLYSNGDVYATRAWTLCTRMKFKNNYTLNGGLNRWFETIIQPKFPAENSTIVEDKLYQSRLGAKQYFLGGSTVVQPTNAATNAAPVKKKKKVAEEEGGC